RSGGDEGRAPLLPAAHERLVAVGDEGGRARVGRWEGRRAPADHAAAEAGAAGDASPLPPALHEAGAGRVPWSPGSGAALAPYLPARRVLALLLGGLSPEARAVLRPRARPRHSVAGR